MTAVRLSGGRTIVTVGGGSARRVTLGRETVAKINDNRPRTVVRDRGVPVNVTTRPTVVRTGGAMGPQGPRGAPGGSIAPIPFAYGDAPRVVHTTSDPGVFSVTRIDIETPFDGDGAVLRVGVAVDAEALMPAEDSDLSTAGSYETMVDFAVTAGTEIVLDIDPGIAATQGAGVLYLTFLPE